MKHSKRQKELSKKTNGMLYQKFKIHIIRIKQIQRSQANIEMPSNLMTHSTRSIDINQICA